MQVNISNSTLARDMNSRALIETDMNKATEYKTKARLFNETRDLKEQMNLLQHKVESLESVRTDIVEIKELIKGLLHK
jgi:cell shape-determining protein MreC